ncbi:unnamed protein product [Agarophyton chilense]
MAEAFVSSFPYSLRGASLRILTESSKRYEIDRCIGASRRLAVNVGPSIESRRAFLYPICSRESWLPPSVASLSENLNGSKIYIVGCVHGSIVSANDVREVLDKTDPDAIVLELCEPRLKALQKTITQKDGAEYAANIKAKTKKTFAQLTESFGGRGPAFVAIILEKVYEFQTLVGVDPGIEFVEPIVRFPRNRVICGDVLATDTVNALFKVFSDPFRSLNDCFSTIVDILNRLIFPPVGGVRFFSVFLRSPARLLELVRLVLPASLVAIFIGLASNAGALAFDMTPMAASISHPMLTSSLPWLSSLIDALLLAYVNISLLRFIKVLIADRDKVLSQNILDTLSKFREGQETPVTSGFIDDVYAEYITQWVPKTYSREDTMCGTSLPPHSTPYNLLVFEPATKKPGEL